jgi:hypothetical protein
MMHSMISQSPYDALLSATSWQEWESAWDSLAHVTQAQQNMALKSMEQSQLQYGMGLLNNLEMPDKGPFAMNAFIAPAASPNMASNNYNSTAYTSPQSTGCNARKGTNGLAQNDAAKFVCNACFMGFRRNRDLKCHINKSHSEE